MTMTWRMRVPALVLAAGVGLSLLPRGPVHATAVPSAGEVLFHEKGCEQCHGVGGYNGERGPDLRGVGLRKTRDEIEHQIREGGGNMPPFGEILEPAEISDLSEYLSKRKMKVKRVAPVKATPRVSPSPPPE